MTEIIDNRSISLYTDGELATADYLNKPLRELINNDLKLEEYVLNALNDILTDIVSQETKLTIFDKNLSKTMNALSEIPIKGSEISGDLTVTNPDNGLILTDRKTKKEYRLFIDNGNLGIEEVE